MNTLRPSGASTRREFLKLSAMSATLAAFGNKWLAFHAGTEDLSHMDILLQNDTFIIGFHPQNGNLTILKRAGDAYDTNYLLGHGLGTVELHYRVGAREWQQASSVLTKDTRQIEYDDPDSPTEATIRFDTDSSKAQGIKDFSLVEHFKLEASALRWTLTFTNRTPEIVEIGDLGLPILFNTRYVRDTIETYTQRVIRHSWVSGDGSFMCLMRPNAEGPYLVMTPLSGTHLEYYTRSDGDGSWEGIYTAYIHSAHVAEQETRGSWRQPRTGAVLQPAGHDGDTITYGFQLRWAMDYDAVREVLHSEGLFDIHVIPGMTIPRDLEARIALRGQREIHAVESEFPDDTTVEYLGRADNGAQLYRVRFDRLGENRLTVVYGDDQRLYLEFFVTEPLATLIKKRAAFIVAHQQVRDPGKWFDGLFSLWDMQECVLRNPDDTGGLYPYMVGGSDDPTLCKAPYVATKNVHYPVPEEIAAIEYYLENFVWGKLQRTDAETPHPYGIYGSDNWYVNRHSDVGFNSGGLGQEHMWRTFDYTHMILLYFNMYQIARLYPELTHYLDKDGYLERAFGTAQAFFTVPYNIKMGERWDFRGWCDWAYKQGNFHELIIPALIDALENEERLEQANWLRGEWEKKVKYFVYDHPYPFGSEMFFDTTAFESTHMIAKYGLENDLKPDQNLWQDKNTGEWYSHPSVRKQDFQDFMEKEIAANIAARGWLETHYYQLGSDIRQAGNTDYLLSYMTQMGGWAILDYALHYADDPARHLRLGYASYLAGWALVNSGPAETHGGFWFPGDANNGAAGWAFKPEQYGPTWMGLPQGRGIWRYDGEIDSGFCGGLRAAATVVINDPLFGPIAYGGQLSTSADSIAVVPRDGLSQRLHLLNISPAVHMILDRDGFAAEAEVRIEPSLSEIAFQLENRVGCPHTATLAVTGLPTGEYALSVDAVSQGYVTATEGQETLFLIELRTSATADCLITRAL